MCSLTVQWIRAWQFGELEPDSSVNQSLTVQWIRVWQFSESDSDSSMNQSLIVQWVRAWQLSESQSDNSVNQSLTVQCSVVNAYYLNTRRMSCHPGGSNVWIESTFQQKETLLGTPLCLWKRSIFVCSNWCFGCERKSCVCPHGNCSHTCRKRLELPRETGDCCTRAVLLPPTAEAAATPSAVQPCFLPSKIPKASIFVLPLLSLLLSAKPNTFSFRHE